MSSQFFPLLRNELTKATRRKLPLFGIFAMALLALVVHLAVGQLGGAATANGWGYVAFSMQLLFTDLGPIFVINFAALLLAQETGIGTIRATLAAPVQRWELYLAKAATGVLYMMVLSLAALLFSVALAKIHFGFGPIGDSFGVIYERKTALREFLIGYVLSWIPLTALVMFGLFMSTIVRTPGAAASVSTGAFFILEFTKKLIGLEPYIFTKDISYPWVVLLQMAQGMDCQWQPDVWRMLLLSGTFALIAFGAGLAIFVRQDLNH